VDVDLTNASEEARLFEAFDLLEVPPSGVDTSAAYRYAMKRRAEDPDDDLVMPWLEAALENPDAGIVAGAHAEIGRILSWHGDPDGIPHLRAAMDARYGHEPMESALYLAYLIDDGIEAELLFRIALDHRDRAHSAEAALAVARLGVSIAPDEAVALAQYCFAWGWPDDRVVAVELLASLGHEEPDVDARVELPRGSSPRTGWATPTAEGSIGATWMPDGWQLEGFSDEDASWWLENGFDLAAAIAWRVEGVEPEAARLWVDGGVPLTEAVEWEHALEDGELDIADALRMRAAGETPTDALSASFDSVDRIRRATKRATDTEPGEWFDDSLDEASDD